MSAGMYADMCFRCIFPRQQQQQKAGARVLVTDGTGRAWSGEKWGRIDWHEEFSRCLCLHIHTHPNRMLSCESSYYALCSAGGFCAHARQAGRHHLTLTLKASQSIISCCCC